MTREEIIKALDEEIKARESSQELRYLVLQPNGKVIAMFLRRWEAEKFIEASEPKDYKLVVD